ncbi:MAG: aspartate/glutamate racemase family protein [Clostridia bacterium]|nr:aspartate/glutamate racemase family protein [Clostridia bacterium]
MKNKKVLGVLGGLGPMSSVYFYETLTSHTKADCDQQHLNILLSSRADIPDRTAFILGKSDSNPLDAMRREVEKLVAAGAEIVAIPCNTAHYFYEGISKSSSVPVLNIIEETVSFCKYLGLSKVGVLATEGTVLSGAYKNVLEREGIEYTTCSEDEQRIISDIIYGAVKQGKEPDLDRFLQVADTLTAHGCERIILGCTELSLLKRNCRLGIRFIDSLDVLSIRAITECGALPQTFDDELIKFAEKKGMINVCC